LSKTFLSFIIALAFFCVGCEGTDIGMVTEAGIEAVRAVTLDDEEVKRLAVGISKQSDLKHTVASPDNSYARRLQRLAADYSTYDGYEFDFKVYLSQQVNAFAMADGSIRIYSGLMDIMDDQELLFVLGHEMGHIVEKHIKKKIMLAYASSAVRKAVASQQRTVGEIARSGFGALAEDFLNARFSQQEERAADDYGVMVLRNEGYGVQPAISALTKLAALGGDHSFLSSHPAPESRAERLRENTLSGRQIDSPSFLSRIVEWVKETPAVLLEGAKEFLRKSAAILGKILEPLANLAVQDDSTPIRKPLKTSEAGPVHAGQRFIEEFYLKTS
jgi:metalloprotease